MLTFMRPALLVISTNTLILFSQSFLGTFAKCEKSNYSKTCLKQNLKGPEHFSAKARFPFNQGTLRIKN